MQPLFCIAVALSVLWIANAAPQPLSLFNTTISEVNNLTTTDFSSDKFQSTTFSPTKNEVATSSESMPSSVEHQTEPATAREEPDFSTLETSKMKETFLTEGPISTNSKNVDSISDSPESITSTGSVFSKPTEDSETLNESEIPITRYVPPLDPMKHLLLMADVKGMSSFSNLMAKVNTVPKITAVDIPTKEAIESMMGDVSIDVSAVSEKEGGFSETVTNEELVTKTTLSAATEIIVNESSETPVEEPSTKVFETESSEPFSSDNVSDKSDSEASAEKVIAESSILKENLEKIVDDTTLASVFASSTDLLKSDGLNTEKMVDSEASSDYSTATEDSIGYSTGSLPSTLYNSGTEIPTDHTTISSLSMTTSDKEVTLGITVKDEEVSETSALHKNVETELKIEEMITAERKEQTESASEATVAIFTSTEEGIVVENISSSDNFLKNIDDIKSETLFSDSETTTFKSITTEQENEVKNIEVLTTRINSSPAPNTTTSVSTTTAASTATAASAGTTDVPETTFDGISSLIITENEKRNISLDDELEFRAAKIPQNISKVSYTENEPAASNVPDAVETDSVSDNNMESTLSTVSTIFSTIAEMLFSSTTTDATTNISVDQEEKSTASAEETTVSAEETTVTAEETTMSAEETSTVSAKETTTVRAEETSTIIAEKDTLIPETALPIEKLDLKVDSDTGAVLSNDPADMLKVEAFTELDSVSAEETTTVTPSTDNLEFNSDDSEQILKVESEDSTEKRHDEDVQNERIVDGTSTKSEMTSTASPDEETTKVTFTTLPTAAVTDVSEDIELKNLKIPENETETPYDPPSEVKPSDYLLNIKDRYVSGNDTDMVAAVQFLHYHDKASSEQCFKLVDAHWNYATNLTEENKKKQVSKLYIYIIYTKFRCYAN